jgi:hypothetical protein
LDGHSKKRNMINGKVLTLTRNKHHLHRPIANLFCFQKGAYYSGIRIFNNLPQSITSLRSEKPQFNPLNAELNPICHLLALLEAHHILHVSRIRVKLALTFFLYAHSFYSVDEFFFVYRCYVLLTYMNVSIFTL